MSKVDPTAIGRRYCELLGGAAMVQAFDSANGADFRTMILKEVSTYIAMRQAFLEGDAAANETPVTHEAEFDEHIIGKLSKAITHHIFNNVRKGYTVSRVDLNAEDGYTTLEIDQFEGHIAAAIREFKYSD